MAILKNTRITGTGHLQLPRGSTSQRPSLTEENFQVVSFTSVGSTTWTVPNDVSKVDVLVVAGGGGGGRSANPYGSGGGGGGGVIYRKNYTVTPGASISITVGGGGSSGNGGRGTNGSNSVFDSLTAIGGGAAGQNDSGIYQGNTGGSGGGGASSSYQLSQFSGTAGQGFPGGGGAGFDPSSSTGSSGPGGGGGGGGGAGGPGGRGTPAGGGGGGIGFACDITGALVYYGGGGGGGIGSGSINGVGGLGGGGTGTNPGTANTGGGGGGGSTGTNGGSGGSGIVIVRYSSTLEENLGNIRFNTEAKDFELYEDPDTKWTLVDPRKNFASHNIFFYSQNFSTWWTLQSVTITSSNNTAPDGTSTASLWTTGAGYTPVWKSGINATIGAVHTMSGHFKASASSTIVFTMGNSSLTDAVVVSFDLSAGTFAGGWTGGAFVKTANSTFVSASIEDQGDGWYRCAMTGIVNSSVNQIRTDFVCPQNSSVFAWGLQLEESNSVGPYSRTEAANSPVPVVKAGHRIHTYTGVGSCEFTPACTGTVEVLVVAGGGAGSGGTYVGGGGGAGGLIYETNYPVIADTRYTVTVGAGGVGTNTTGPDGQNSIFGTLVAIGGGGGGAHPPDAQYGRSGGSGGGGSQGGGGPGFGVIGQGNPGGGFIYAAGAGGGGAGGARRTDNMSPAPYSYGQLGVDGGVGRLIDITGEPKWYAGGGGGGARSAYGVPGGLGGLGGGGNGATSGGAGAAGAANTGGGGGGGWSGVENGTTRANGGNGGSGIVVVRYRYE